MQRQKKQLIAVVVVLVLFIAAYAGMRMYNGKESAKEEVSKAYITDVKTEEITAFSYQFNNSAQSFTRAEDTWTCEEDNAADLDESKINILLGNLEKLEAEEVVENPDELSEYGFAEPENVITFTTKEGSTTLTIGMKNEITGQYYLTKNSDDKLYLVSTAMPESFKKSYTDLIALDTETEALQ